MNMKMREGNRHDEEPVLVSVIIKVLNEARNIERAVQSALAAVALTGGEVVLADSRSTDDTVAIASKYPIRIVRLIHTEDRSCGVGAQLGYQHAKGQFVYVMDGDMRMNEGFLQAAVEFMMANPGAGGVGGLVAEQNLEALEYASRASRSPDHLSPGQVSRLDSGGLYRRSAVEAVGYLTDRNLHSYEEIDLGARLRAAGWTLHRIQVHAVDHWGHTTNAVELMMKRWRTGYLFGIGEVLRASLGKSHFRIIASELRELWIYAAVFGWIVLTAIVGFSGLLSPALILGMILLPWLAISLRKRSVRLGTYSVYGWLMNIPAVFVGLVRSRTSPTRPIDSELVQEIPDYHPGPSTSS